MKKQDIVYSIVVPAFNEEEVIRASYERLRAVMEGMGEAYELLFVDDGSRDSTPYLLKQIAGADPKARGLRFSRNFGHQAAISAGMEKARGAAVVVIDADLQDPPEAIPAMAAKWKAGAEVVYGLRAKRKGEGLFKKATAKLFYRFINRLSDVKLPVDAGDFRLIDRKVRDALCAMPEKHRYVRGMVSWLGFRQESVEYVREARFAGVTKYPLSKMLKFALDAITSFSNKPLKIASWIGFAVSLAGFAYLLYVLYLRVFTSATVEGWSSIVAIVIIFNGLTLLFLGLLGEYVGRIHDEVKGRPLFVVSEEYGDAAED